MPNPKQRRVQGSAAARTGPARAKPKTPPKKAVKNKKAAKKKGAELVQERREKELMMLKLRMEKAGEHMKEAAEREGSHRHSHHVSQEIKHKVSRKGHDSTEEIQQRIKEIDAKTATMIEEMRESKAIEEMNRLTGIKVELMAEREKLSVIRTDLAKSKEKRGPNKGQLDWLKSRERMVASQIKKIDGRMDQLSQKAVNNKMKEMRDKPSETAKNNSGGFFSGIAKRLGLRR